jgi:AAA15 family ATPase/GTPase
VAAMDFISGVYIRSFRGIKSLKLENLAQINILTGDNNCGKTSVLEVLRSFEEPGSFRTWRSMIRKETRYPIGWGISYYEGFYDLFDINSSEKAVDYIIETGSERVNIQLTAVETEEEFTEEEYSQLQGLSASKEYKEENLTENLQIVPKLEMKIKINGKVAEQDVLYEGQRRYMPVRKKDSENYSERRNIVYIAPFSHTDSIIFLDQVLNNPELYEEMLTVLREFDDNIVSINYSNDDSRGAARGVYKILTKSLEKALPLNMYGDGMKKAVLLMSAVIRAKNGVLLLDEFETAIHTSAMDKVFKWILENCMKLNVQVFLTSHSKEAIDKMLKCAPDIRKDMAVYTLYKEGAETSVRRLSAEKAIEVQDEMGLELR